MAAIFGRRCRVDFWLRSTTVLPSRRASSSRYRLKKIMQENLEGIKAAGTWKTERIIVSPQAASIKVHGQEGGVLNFCANNYLGLAVRTILQCKKYLICSECNVLTASSSAHTYVVPSTGDHSWSTRAGKQRSRSQFSSVHLWHSSNWFSVAHVHVVRLEYYCSAKLCGTFLE